MAKVQQLFDTHKVLYQKTEKLIKEFRSANDTAPVGLLSTVEYSVHSVQKQESVLVATMITTTKPKQRKKPYIKPPAVKNLEQLADEDNQRKHPNTPVKYLAKCKYRDDTYSGLVKCIVDFVRLKGGTAQRLASSRPQDTRQTVRDVIGRKYEIGSIDYRPEPSGSRADIHAVIHGWSVLIAARPGSHCHQDGNVFFFADFTQFLKWYEKSFAV